MGVTEVPRFQGTIHTRVGGIWDYSSHSAGGGDISNLSWAKDAVLAQAIREREVAYELANDPSKCPVKRSQRATSAE